MNPRRVLLAAAVAVAAAAGAPAQLEVMLPPSPVGFGEAFELRVSSPRDAAPLDPSALSPLWVELLETRAAGDRELRRYRARCFELGEVALPAAPQAVLRVVSGLPDPAGPAEYPAFGYPLPGRRPVGLWLGLLLALAIGAWSTWRYRRRAAGVPAAPLAAGWSASAALGQLQLPGASDSPEPFYHQLKAVIRQHAAVHHGQPAAVRTSEELCKALAAGGAALGDCLGRCDAVLFGRARPRPQDHAAALAAARAFAAGAPAEVGD